MLQLHAAAHVCADAAEDKKASTRPIETIIAMTRIVDPPPPYLIALGCDPKTAGAGQRPALEYAVAGYGHDGDPAKAAWSIVIGNRHVRFDPLTGNLLDENKLVKPPF